MAQIQMLLLRSIIFLLALIFTYVSAQPYKALVSPITKDTTTSLYSITLNFYERYVIDLGGPFLWYRCPKRFPKVPCTSHECSTAQSYLSPSCPPFHTATDHCECIVTPINPITKTCASSNFTYNDLIIYWTDGRVPTVGINFNHLFVSCAPQSLFESLPAGASGMASLSRSPLALTTQFTPEVRKQFAICLPSTSAAPGVLFFGEGPFHLLPPTQFDVTSILSYTPLLTHLSNLEYYIGLKGISINGKPTPFLARMLEFDAQGHGGVKLDTLVPYTSLRSHIYRAFLKDFAKATRGIPRARRVKPFGLCLNTRKLGFTRVGLPVPQIDLELGNGKNWTIFGANSMKQVSDNVACLAFVDGGERAAQAVVIGSFQMENNFLLFDLVESRLGFSSSLLFMRTTCANFNFTSGN